MNSFKIFNGWLSSNLCVVFCGSFQTHFVTDRVFLCTPRLLGEGQTDVYPNVGDSRGYKHQIVPKFIGASALHFGKLHIQTLLSSLITKTNISCYRTRCTKSWGRVKKLNVVVCMCNVYDYECECQCEWIDKKRCEWVISVNGQGGLHSYVSTRFVTI